MSYLSSIIASIRVGWSRDFGWTNPFLGFSLKTIAPIASTMTAVTVLYIGFRNGTSIGSSQFPMLLGFILIGATLYAHISAYSWVPTLAIAEGKWTFVFPQVYVSPKSSPPFLDIGNVLPFTEFIRASRAVLLPLGSVSSYFYYLGLSFVGGSILLVISLLAFRYAEGRARRLGVLDRKVV